MAKTDHKAHRSRVKQGYYERQRLKTEKNKQRRAQKRKFKRDYWASVGGQTGTTTTALQQNENKNI